MWSQFVTFVSPGGAVKVEFHPYTPSDTGFTPDYHVVVKLGDKIAAHDWLYGEPNEERAEFYRTRHESGIRQVSGMEE